MTDEMTVEMIEAIGPSMALCWYLSAGLFPPVPDAYEDAVAAIEAMAAGYPDEVVLTDEDGEPVAYAHHLVSLWYLQPFVEAQMNVNPAIVTLDEPWWVIEGFVVAPGSYIVVGLDGPSTKVVLTSKGEARLLEPSDGVEPTAYAVL